MADLAPALLHVLRHALGTGEDGRKPAYRNHFVTGEGSDDHATCMVLVFMGLMCRHAPSVLSGGDDIFTVTQAGREAEASNRVPAPKMTRSQRRYQAFLDADSGVTFGEWIRAKFERPRELQ